MFLCVHVDTEISERLDDHREQAILIDSYCGGVWNMVHRRFVSSLWMIVGVPNRSNTCMPRLSLCAVPALCRPLLLLPHLHSSVRTDVFLRLFTHLADTGQHRLCNRETSNRMIMVFFNS